jgi:aspartate aminotransferase-like enzyme
MGYCDTFDVITAVAAVEMVLKEMGSAGELGRGVARAQEILMKK